MYRCTICGDVVGPRVAQKKKVLETRMVVHHDTFTDKEGYTHHRETHGTQIVKEVPVCGLCLGHLISCFDDVLSAQ